MVDDSLLDSLEDEGPIDDITPKPNKQPGRSRAKTAVKAPPYRRDMFVEPLTQIYAMMGLGISLRDQHCGQIIVTQAGDCARAWDQLAKENPAVRKALASLTMASAWTPVIMSHLPIALAVFNHNVMGNEIEPGVISDNAS